MASHTWWSEGPEETSLGTLLSIGGAVVWCSNTCRELWLRVALAREIEEDPVAVEVDAHACSHCHWCGDQVAVPEAECLRHGERCPLRDFFATAVAVELVHVMTPPGLLVSVPWLFLKLASNVWRTNPDITPSRLASITSEAWDTYRREQERRDELG